MVETWPPWPSYSLDEIAVAKDVLLSGHTNYWTGQQGLNFERELSSYIGVEHAIAIANGSISLGIALRALGLRPGAEVIVTPRTFIASVSEIVLSGAVPVFADVDRDSQNISAETVEAMISDRAGAILAVHLAGWPCDMGSIGALAKEHGLPVIEDCAQSHGAEIDGRKTGNLGDIAAFSFCHDKIMSTGGEGGMIMTDNDDYWARCWSFKDHGKRIEAIEATSSDVGFKWLHESIGTNGRLTELQAAIGRCQLAMLDEWIELRNRNAGILNDHLEQVEGLRVTRPPENIRHAYYKYYVFVQQDALKSSWSRDRILSELSLQGIPCGSGICPEVYLEKAYSYLPTKLKGRLPVARALGETSLMFPVHPTMNEHHMAQISDALMAVMEQAVK